MQLLTWSNFRFIIIIYLICWCNIASSQSYGLRFQGHNVALDKRTELNLSPEKLLEFKDEFEITFDYKLDYIVGATFGYVFRVINQENNNIDLLSTPTPDNMLNLVIGKSNSIINVTDITRYNNSWINLRTKFNLSENRVILYTPDTFYVFNDIGFQEHDSFKIIFGANDYGQFKTTDVPSMNLRDIKIYEKGNLQFHWPLEQKEGTIINDKIRKKEAAVKNPDWLMLNHQTWQTELENEIDGYIQIAVDEENEIFYVLNENNYQVYSPSDKILKTHEYKEKPLFFNSSYRAVYNSNDNKIYSYVVDYDWPTFSFDPATGEWNETGFVSNSPTIFMHHNNYFNPDDNSIWLFGGYGLHKYNNNIRRINLENLKKTDLSSSDSVYFPRYLAGMGELNDTLYILGGYGSVSGNQLINPHSYYDLIGYSLESGTFFRKFELPGIIDDMAVGNTIWIDSESRNFYALVFEKSLSDGYLQLIRGNLDIPDIEMPGTKIPFRFLDIKSFASLFYFQEQNKLYSVNSYFDEYDKTQLAIHAISYPPDIYKENKTKAGDKNSSWIVPLILVVLLLFLIVGHVLRNRIKRKKAQLVRDENLLTSKAGSEQFTYTDKTNYQLIFFGGFQIFDKNYKDITNKFSPLLKELFLLIMLNTFKNNKGISSEKITETLWFEKSEKSARNNRSVNMVKLRSILKDIGTFELSKKTGYWKIKADENSIKSDYLDFLSITESRTNLTKEKILMLLEITEKGAFLQNVHYDWLNDFKAIVSDTIIDTLVEFGYSCDIKKEAEFIIHLADSVFNFDIVSEDAMVLKCQAEYCMGKHGTAKATYNRFFNEYKNMYGQEYNKSFVKILKLDDQ